MTERVQIPRCKAMQKSTSPAWWMAFDDEGKPFAVQVRCPAGHESTMRYLGSSVGHVIDLDGNVEPSLICPGRGCRWNVVAQLERWDPLAE